jgi:hypothetical protein
LAYFKYFSVNFLFLAACAVGFIFIQFSLKSKLYAQIITKKAIFDDFYQLKINIK